MKAATLLLLSSICAGCLFEAQRAFGCGDVGVLGCKDQVEPVSAPLQDREDRSDVLIGSEGQRYLPGTPSWVPLIDECMAAGGQRGDCIRTLPPAELAKLEAAEAERAAARRAQMRYRRAGNVLGVAASTQVEQMVFDAFGVEIASGWLLSVETTRDANGWGDLVTLRHPNRQGELRLQSYAAPAPITDGVLRNITNVPATEVLARRDWGDYSGYDYDYVENGSFFRHWWLARGKTMLVVTYQGDGNVSDGEVREVDGIVSSLKAVR